MKKNITIGLWITLLFLGVINIQPINAQNQGNFTINIDGSISPSTAPILQIDDVYTLIDDVFGSITVMKSNITFDGNGHSIVGLGSGHGVGGLSIGCNYYSHPPILTGASNVTVKNLIVKSSPFGISLLKAINCLIINNTVLETGNEYLSLDQQTAGIYFERSSSNVIKANTISNNYNGILLVESKNNLIIENTIADSNNPWNYSAVGITFWGASNNIIYHNNFLNNTIQAYSSITIAAAGITPIARNLWDNGYPDGGNYWSDYQTKYPNASLIENSGIGNTSYYIDEENNDNYPLMQPFTASLSPEIISSPTKNTNGTSMEFPILVAFIVLASMAVIAMILVFLFTYSKKKHH
jgi:parallel beta-helix repeat protein